MALIESGDEKVTSKWAEASFVACRAEPNLVKLISLLASLLYHLSLHCEHPFGHRYIFQTVHTHSLSGTMESMTASPAVNQNLLPSSSLLDAEMTADYETTHQPYASKDQQMMDDDDNRIQEDPPSQMMSEETLPAMEDAEEPMEYEEGPAAVPNDGDVEIQEYDQESQPVEMSTIPGETQQVPIETSSMYPAEEVIVTEQSEEATVSPAQEGHADAEVSEVFITGDNAVDGEESAGIKDQPIEVLEPSSQVQAVSPAGTYESEPVEAHSGDQKEQGEEEGSTDTGVFENHQNEESSNAEEASEQVPSEEQQYVSATEKDQPQDEESHVAASGDGQDGDDDQEAQSEDDMQLESIRLTFNDQSFALFSQDSESTGYLAWDENANAITTSPAPGLVIDDQVFWQPLDQFFGALRVKEVLGEFLDNESGSELVMEFPELQLTVGEDNIYARDVTLADLARLHQGLGLEESMHVKITEDVRFISQYNLLADQVATLIQQRQDQERSLDEEASDEGEEESNAAVEAEEQQVEEAGADAIDHGPTEESSVAHISSEEQGEEAAEPSTGYQDDEADDRLQSPLEEAKPEEDEAEAVGESHSVEEEIGEYEEEEPEPEAVETYAEQAKENEDAPSYSDEQQEEQKETHQTADGDSEEGDYEEPAEGYAEDQPVAAHDEEETEEQAFHEGEGHRLSDDEEGEPETYTEEGEWPADQSEGEEQDGATSATISAEDGSGDYEQANAEPEEGEAEYEEEQELAEEAEEGAVESYPADGEEEGSALPTASSKRSLDETDQEQLEDSSSDFKRAKQA